MKFTAFKEFRGAFQNTLEDVSFYLKADLKKFLRELQLGLTKLSLADNFDSFIVTVTIPATTEVAIRNELINAGIPTQKIIVRGKDGAQNVVDGDTEWTSTNVYLKNTGAASVTVTVAFLK